LLMPNGQQTIKKTVIALLGCYILLFLSRSNGMPVLGQYEARFTVDKSKSYGTIATYRFDVAARGVCSLALFLSVS
jgi:hypothetical protein